MGGEQAKVKLIAAQYAAIKPRNHRIVRLNQLTSRLDNQTVIV